MIAQVWLVVFGEDLSQKRTFGNRQVRVICPFHHDASPSCDISLAKNAFICRSCDAHGGYLDVVVLAGYADSRRMAAAWLQSRGITLC